MQVISHLMQQQVGQLGDSFKLRSFILTVDAAAQKYQQGFHFVNCGADIVALTSSMSSEIQRVKTLVLEKGS
jgi:hypothetical protein